MDRLASGQHFCDASDHSRFGTDTEFCQASFWHWFGSLRAATGCRDDVQISAHEILLVEAEINGNGAPEVDPGSSNE
jgi:hypothetical protein